MKHYVSMGGKATITLSPVTEAEKPKKQTLFDRIKELIKGKQK